MVLSHILFLTSKLLRNSNLKKNNPNGNDPFYVSSRDFFEGGLKALDSIKGLGLQVSFKVIEIKPNSEKTAIISQLKNNGISRSNMVFMPNYVNELAVVSEFLASKFQDEKYKFIAGCFGALLGGYVLGQLIN